jgi:hypothetical protein
MRKNEKKTGSVSLAWGSAKGGNRLIFSNYEKAYETQGYETKILRIKIEIHPGHAIAPLVWSQPHDILQFRSPLSLTINEPKTEAKSNPVIPTFT